MLQMFEPMTLPSAKPAAWTSFLVEGVDACIAFYREIAARRDRLASLQADVRKAQETASRLPEFEADVEALEAVEPFRAVRETMRQLLRRFQRDAWQLD